jgi:hypothetical protein
MNMPIRASTLMVVSVLNSTSSTFSTLCHCRSGQYWVSGQLVAEAQCLGHLHADFSAGAEDLLHARIRLERLALFDPKGGHQPAHGPVFRIHRLRVHELGQSLKVAVITRKDHVGRLSRPVGEAHLGWIVLLGQRVDAGLLHQGHRLGRIAGFLVAERPPEHEDVVGRALEAVVALRRLAFIVRRQDQVFAALALVGTHIADIGHGPVPEVVEDALLLGRHLDHGWAVRLQVDIAHGVDHVRIGRADDGLGTEPILPDDQDVGAGAELRFRALLHRPKGHCR